MKNIFPIVKHIFLCNRQQTYAFCKSYREKLCQIITTYNQPTTRRLQFFLTFFFRFVASIHPFLCSSESQLDMLVKNIVKMTIKLNKYTKKRDTKTYKFMFERVVENKFNCLLLLLVKCQSASQSTIFRVCVTGIRIDLMGYTPRILYLSQVKTHTQTHLFDSFFYIYFFVEYFFLQIFCFYYLTNSIEMCSTRHTIYINLRCLYVMLKIYSYVLVCV